MTLTSLKVDNVRNLNAVSLKLHESLNLFVGDNGSGKSSLLEAIYFMFTGRSFRTARISQVITHHTKFCVAAGRLFRQSEQPVSSTLGALNSSLIDIGIQKFQSGKVEAKLGSTRLNSAVELAKLRAIQLFSPEDELLIDSSSENKRRFLDWALFHVEHRFYPTWKRLKKVIQQRNAELRSGPLGFDQMSVWNNQLCDLSQEIHQQRRAHVDALNQSLKLGPFPQLIDDLNIGLEYQPGWLINRSEEHEQEALYQQLKEGFDRDRDRGYTQHGAHRADLKITANHRSAKDQLSRGQKKAVSLHFKMLQAKLISEKLSHPPIILLDDIRAELDEHHVKILLGWLEQFESQVFITAISVESIENFFTNRSLSMFHVEHGSVKQLEEVII